MLGVQEAGMKKYLVSIILAAILGVATVSVVGAQGGGSVHYVAYGDTLYSIAAQYGVSTQAIMRQNGITNQDLIYVGQPLVIPGAQNTPTYYNAKQCPGEYYIIGAGETLSDIAYEYGLTLHELANYNSLYNNDMIYAGQKICLPPAAGYNPQPASYRQGYNPPANAYYHIVAYGDTLGIIADQYGVSYLDIMRANNLNNAGFIMIGQRLIIPGYQPSPVVDYAPPPVAAPPPAVGYAPPPVVRTAPPYAPVYDDAVVESTDAADVPPAPEHQSVPVPPLLPESDHPLEVVINGGVNWVGNTDTFPDPNDITTLIVKTGDELGVTVHVRSGDYEVKGESDFINTVEFGPHRFVFRYIPPGDYDVWIDDPDRPSEIVHVKVEPGDRASVFFEEGVSFGGPNFASPSGWVVGSWDNPSKPAQNIGSWSNILIETPASGLWVMIESEGGGYKAKCLTGSKGPGSCDFAGLSAGLYWIWIDGTDLVLKTYMDGAAYATFQFTRQPTASSENVVGPVSYDEGS